MTQLVEKDLYIALNNTKLGKSPVPDGIIPGSVGTLWSMSMKFSSHSVHDVLNHP